MVDQLSQGIRPIITEPQLESSPGHGPALAARPGQGFAAGAGSWKQRVARSPLYRVGLALLLLAYLASTGWLLLSSNFLPYVMDNNESFSSLVHATNLDRFGFSSSFGLTDEAYGPNPAAHPYLHTHQGNFPRLFSFLIYKLGAHSVEAQI